MKVKISGSYGSHLAPLIKCMSLTSGDVIELGIGFYSTPYLHYQCLLDKRHLTSVDNEKGWIKTFATSDFAKHRYQGQYHQFIYVENWNDLDLSKGYDVALVDSTPDELRKELVKKLAHNTKYIIIHDSNQTGEYRYRNYRYNEIFPLFKYRKDWTSEERHATVLSNFVDLEDLW